MRYLAMKLFGALLLPLLAGCGALGEPPQRSERAQTRLSRALDGKIALEPQRCLPRYRSLDQEIVDRGTILFRDGRNRVFRNDPEGGCPGLDPGRILVVRPLTGELCRGDIVQVVDSTTGTQVGSCAFSDFVPFVVPGSRADRRGS